MPTNRRHPSARTQVHPRKLSDARRAPATAGASVPPVASSAGRPLRRVREVVFVVCVAVVVCTVIGWLAIAALSPIEAKTRSTLEGRSYQTLPALAASTLADGSFQDDFEQYVADSVPLRDGVLLANAAVQRISIGIANLACGFDCRPTYYGSEVYWSEERELLFRLSDVVVGGTAAELRNCAESYDEVVEAHPDVNWVYCQIENERFSTHNPAADLTGEVCDIDFVEEHFLANLPEAVTAVRTSYESADEIDADFFATDHHWNINGAIRAYETCAEALGIEPVEFGEVTCAWEGPFWGASAREGLMAAGTGDAIYDVDYDHSDLSVTVDGKAEDASWLDASWADDYDGYEPSDTWANCYAEYFHPVKGIIEVDNEDISDGSTLLIFGESYVGTMERFFAEGYEHVVHIDQRYVDMTTEEAIEAYDPDDVLIVHFQTQSCDGYLDDGGEDSD